jgi:CHAT domain-containing protein/Tfp pilus assembly protein PilF
MSFCSEVFNYTSGRSKYINQLIIMVLRYRLNLLQFNLVIVLLLCHACGKWQDNELAMLQRAYVFSDSENEREEIVDQLEEYFLKMPIPDSLEQKLYNDVETLLNDYESESQTSLENYKDEPNIYLVEGKFYSQIKSKMIILAKNGTVSLKEMDSIAQYLDSELDINYWCTFFKNIKNYSPEQAKHWLYAQRASQECKRYLNSFDKLKIGLMYASVGLKHLVDVKDERIRLDILQRVQYGLYKYYGYSELSIALAKRYVPICRSIGYKLRENSILSHIGYAYFLSGKLSSALDTFQDVVSIAKQNKTVPFMDWYLKNGLLGLADTYTWSGNYKQALTICDSIGKKQLSDREKLSVFFTRGLVYRNLGNYEEAEKNYNIALNLAESTNDFENKFKTLNNFGFLFLELSEYQKALEYFTQAFEYVELHSPDSWEIRINLLINLASVYVKLGEHEQIESCLSAAKQDLAHLGENPLREADLLNTLGSFQMDIEQYAEANKSLEEAVIIFDKNGLIKNGLDAKLNLAKSLISLSECKQAKTKISEVLTIANDIDNIEREIDAYALLANLESLEGNINEAIQLSNKLIDAIDVLSHKINNPQRLIAYQQKINKYLKEAIIYELRLNRLDSALVKLDYAKSLTFMKTNMNGADKLEKLKKINVQETLRNIYPDIQIINYMLNHDTLYTFLINENGISVLRKKVDYDSLRTTVRKYTEAINNTISVFKNYTEQNAQDHYDLTTSLAYQLYRLLFDKKITDKLNNPNSLLYIIPDDYLHFIPFATLVTRQNGRIQFLIEKAKIAYLPGVLSLLNNNERKKISNKTILLSADPELIDIRKLSSFVTKHYPKTQVLNSSPEFVEKQKILASIENKYDIYLFAGHSYANSKDITMSYINLSLCTDNQFGDNNIQLTMSDINKMKWNHTDLIFLLGCETAAGNLYHGMGISGLQSSFLLSGANNVLASLWRIDADHASRQAMDFMHEFARTNDYAAAIKETQLKAIHALKLNNYYKNPHPYFWGSYLLSQKNCFSN